MVEINSFKDGRENVCDKPCSSHPSVFTHNLISAVDVKNVCENRRVTILKKTVLFMGPETSY